ncbi:MULTISPECIES: TonB-dependent siderophore receptor [unclassified Pseudomonas]|uniref:TonB-dependent siderophore receptor n=1 Tax=unclassified Pseudomonas TaxID=196821 RepID=UPI000BD65CB4|nr:MULTISPECIES: TonB-dependent siderophore receptor [unclassified Pseudomonas]PVZ16520.1 iron complex outermembrane receptor protein [Pseudomonas sp. URIL14HWK12:I12]PVZ25624.1 iron complex outermembrane receptor protein [Pseudomonas sp. URIL14HWK12:I10]PVZ36852.1 iron complex outermembrane receptor protein [Pseudomonas sp. URIL14HWK12:I11]SNZ12483.1 iron complex outermembrane recepter protein [Pseudomonas sp. URIL14HWK12:I9]
MRYALTSLCVLNLVTPLALADEAASLDLPTLNIEGTAQRSEGSYQQPRSASATKTEADLHEVPQSVSVVPPQVLEDTNVTRLQDALDYGGGIGRANNFGGQGLTTYTVRGFTTGEFYRNGFPVNRGYPNAPDANTLDHIDILRGPAATLYGRSDPGGTFNVVTKQPQAERKTTIGGQMDDQGMYRGTLDTTGAVGSGNTLLYRLNVLGEGGDSFRDNVETERYDLAPVIQWQATDATRITFEGDYMRNNHPLDRGNTHYPGQVGVGSRDTYVWEKGSTNLLNNDNNVSQLRFDHQLNDNWSLSGGVQWLDGTLHGNAVEANGIAADGRTLGRNFNWRKLEWSDRDYQLNLAGTFNTGSIEHTLLAGVEYEQYDYRSIILRSSGALGAYPVDLFNPVLGQARPALTRTTTHDHEQLDSTSAYIQDQMQLTERLKLLVGARLERDEHDYDNKLPNSVDWNKNENAVTPRYGLVYDLTPAVAVYGSYSQSFKPNTGASAQGAGFDAEEGKSYELGVKWKALDDQLTVDAAVFHTLKDNVLTPDPANVNFSVAAGRVRSRGLDLNIAGNITPQWRVIGGYSYVDAEVVKDNSLATGTRLANIPRSSYNLLNVYEFHEGRLNGLGLGLGVRHVAERAGQTANSTYSMAGYTVADVLTFYQVTPQLRVNLDVKNLFDEAYEEGAFNQYAYPGAPRTVQTGFTYSF